jgi:hypothetical protein
MFDFDTINFICLGASVSFHWMHERLFPWITREDSSLITSYYYSALFPECRVLSTLFVVCLYKICDIIIVENKQNIDTKKELLQAYTRMNFNSCLTENF